MSTAPLPFLSFTPETIQQMNPIDAIGTILCEVVSIKAKAGKKDKNSTNLLYTFTCIDDNSPMKGRNGYKTIPMGYPSMHAGILCAVMQIERDEIQPGSFDPNMFIGKQLYVKFDLTDDGNGGANVQPVDYFRADRPPVK